MRMSKRFCQSEVEAKETPRKQALNLRTGWEIMNSLGVELGE